MLDRWLDQGFRQGSIASNIYLPTSISHPWRNRCFCMKAATPASGRRVRYFTFRPVPSSRGPLTAAGCVLMLQLQLVCCAWRPPASHRPLLRPSRRGGRARPPALGVPGFSTWMDVQFATSRSRVPEGFSADVVAFDLNSLLHNQLRRAADEPHAIKLTFQKLHATLRCVRPESTVLLAIDGSGPMAKMATQQSRRRKTASKRALADGARGLSPLLLTPGTQFMERLEQAGLLALLVSTSRFYSRSTSMVY